MTFSQFVRFFNEGDLRLGNRNIVIGVSIIINSNTWDYSIKFSVERKW